MQIWRKPEDVPADLTRTVVTIGIFDGVHRGHHAVIAQTVKTARELNALAVALTFHPHPKLVHEPGTDLQLVTSLEDRLERLEALGLDAVYVQEYTLDYARATPEEFVSNQIVRELRAVGVVVGEDVRFGCQNMGDAATLQTLGAKYDFGVTLVDDLCQGEDARRWSSTWVRELLERGDVAGARDVLGRWHRLRGRVVHGHKRGRLLGFPTANLAAEDVGVVPADGVYAGWLIRHVPESTATEYLPAAISIGSNVQFEATERTVEAHVLGRADLDLYGEEVAIDLVEYLRPMLAFDSVDELLDQMDEDLRQTAETLGVPVSGRVDPAAVLAGADAVESAEA